MSTSTTESATQTRAEAVDSALSSAEQGDLTPKGPTTKQEAVKRAYSEATTALRISHRDEFNADVKTRVESFGFQWEPKPTKTEKALAEIRALMEENGIIPRDLA